MDMEESSRQDSAAFYAVKQSNLMVVCGIVVLLMVVLSGLSGTATLGAVSVIMIVMGVWWRKSPLVEFRDDNLVINRGPVRSKLTLLYSEILRVEYKRSACKLHYRLHGSEVDKDRKIGIASSGLLQKDRDRFELVLQNRVGSDTRPQEIQEG